VPKLPLFLVLFDMQSVDRLIAQSDDVVHDAVGGLDSRPLALFGWFRHGGCLVCKPLLAETTFQSSPLLGMHNNQKGTNTSRVAVFRER
jgi:hypothetical protein